MNVYTQMLISPYTFMHICKHFNPCIYRENAAASLVVMQGNNDKLRAAYFNDLKEDKLTESNEKYPPYQADQSKTKQRVTITDDEQYGTNQNAWRPEQQDDYYNNSDRSVNNNRNAKTNLNTERNRQREGYYIDKTAGGLEKNAEKGRRNVEDPKMKKNKLKNKGVVTAKSAGPSDLYENDLGMPNNEYREMNTMDHELIAGLSKSAKQNHPYNFSYGDEGYEEEIRREIDPNIAGISTGTKQNHPYNFSYGDQGMPEEKEYREPDNGFVAGKASNGQQNHPYNFSYGDPQEDSEDIRRDIDPNFIAGMSTGTKQNHPYNFSYDDQRFVINFFFFFFFFNFGSVVMV